MSHQPTFINFVVRAENEAEKNKLMHELIPAKVMGDLKVKGRAYIIGNVSSVKRKYGLNSFGPKVPRMQRRGVYPTCMLSLMLSLVTRLQIEKSLEVGGRSLC